MPFGNPIVAGTTLVRNAIQSDNFRTGVSGWRIKRDGTAEFQDATIRGQLIVGASPHSWQVTDDVPAIIAAYYVDNYGTQVKAVTIQGIHTDEYSYVALLDGVTTYVLGEGQVIVNTDTLVQEVYETAITTLATNDGVTVQPVRKIIGNQINPTTRPLRIEYVDETQLAYNGVPMTIVTTDDDALTGGPFTLTTSTQLSNCAVTFTSDIATTDQPAKVLIVGVFDFDVTATSAGNLCEGVLDHNGSLQSAIALLAMNNITRQTVAQQWRINVTNRNAHTFTLGYLKAAAGGTAVLHAVHTTIMMWAVDTLA